jgi:hypothetical protein
VGALLLALTACVTERDPLGPVNGPTGGSGTNVSNNALVGEWEATILITAGGDVQTWVTSWIFRDDQTCTWHQEVTSVLEGITRERTRQCVWSSGGSLITITYLDNDTSEQLPFEFPAFDGTRLILQGIEFERIS